MNLIVTIALILDFSGSMYQKVLDKTKFEVLKEKMIALTSTYSPDDQILVLSFGSDLKNTCADVSTKSMSVKEFSSWIKKQTPKQFAKTPLSLAIKKLGQLKKEYNITEALIITDGADSCNSNPCIALEQVSKDYKKSNTKLNIDLIGYDLQENKSTIECPIENLKNMNFKYHQASSDADLEDAMSRIDQGFKERQIKQDSSDSLLNNSVNDSRNNSNNSSLNKKSNGKNDNKAKDALLSVTNAPSSSTFIMTNTSNYMKKWNGSFSVKIPAGKYEIRLFSAQLSPEKDSKTIDIILGASEIKKINYSDFLFNKKAFLKITNLLFPITLEHIPDVSKVKTVSSNETLENKNKKIKRYKKTLISKPKKFRLQPGTWKVSVNNPWWLGTAFSKTFKVFSGKTKTFDFKKIWNPKLQWISPAKKDNDAVVIMTSPQGKEQRVLFHTNSAPIPIHNKWSYYWVTD